MIAARKGKAWGNALGGYKTQSRGPGGRFASGVSVGNSLHKKARKRKGGVVPYVRKGVGHTTVGANAGVSITKNRRVSAGFYVKTQSNAGQVRAKKIRKAEALAQAAVAAKLSPDNRATAYGEAVVRNKQSRAWRKLVGAERKIPGTVAGYGRVGTDMNGLPTAVVQFNSPRDRKKGSRKKRDGGTKAYTKMVTKTRGHKVKGSVNNSRPERRNQNRG